MDRTQNSLLQGAALSLMAGQLLGAMGQTSNARASLGSYRKKPSKSRAKAKAGRKQRLKNVRKGK